MNFDAKGCQWWGWGSELYSFNLHDKPGLVAYLQEKKLLGPLQTDLHFAIDQVQIPPSQLPEKIMLDILTDLAADECSTADEARIIHSYGKSYRDLLRVRSGKIEQAPDIVFYPSSETSIIKIFRLCARHQIALVPFGGGTSVVGGVESHRGPHVYVASLDLKRLHHILCLDTLSQTAEVQAGILGPDLEAGLAEQGYTLGHFPQSFEFSTLGGWIAARSSGQNSIRYGGIENMVVAVKILTPQGEIQTVHVPRHATGPDLQELLLGSEGCLGVIVSATIKISLIPKNQDYFLLACKNFKAASDIARHIIQSDIHAAMVRVSDETETASFLAMSKSNAKGIKKIKEQMAHWYLKWSGLQPSQMVFLMIGLEGDEDENRKNETAIQKILQKYQTLHLGRKPGRKWFADRFKLPYLRDTLMNQNILIDTFETATSWSNLHHLYESVQNLQKNFFEQRKIPCLLLCHISHLYHDGASLYFTVMAKQEADPMQQWYDWKQVVSEAIMSHGGVISHHHGVGMDHKNYLNWGPTERGMMQAVKTSLDPHNIMNPGKLL